MTLITLGDKYKVHRLGSDSTGRPIYMSPRMYAAWLVVLDRLDFDPVIVQGAFMKYAGGGASASAGYHDLSSCIDTRTWDIDSKEERAVIHAGRSVGWFVHRRDQRDDMGEHMHWALLDEPHSASGAVSQWAEYRGGGDGIGGIDRHWRPDPIPVFNFKEWKENQMTKAEAKEAFKEVLASEEGKHLIRNAVWHSGDVFPNDGPKDVTHNSVLAKLWNSLSK